MLCTEREEENYLFTSVDVTYSSHHIYQGPQATFAFSGRVSESRDSPYRKSVEVSRNYVRDQYMSDSRSKS